MKNKDCIINNEYWYSYNHKHLSYLPQKENYEHKEQLTVLYKNKKLIEDVHFIQINSQMIQNAICLTNQVIFEVTEKCNLSCSYCALGDTYKYALKERSQNMNWQTAKNVLDFYIPKWKNDRPKKFKKYCYIGFHGGEPLLNMHLIKQIIDYVEEEAKDLDFKYSMTTNGTLLLKHIKYIVEKNFLLTVSMDGNEFMNSYRVYNNGKEVYNELFSNLKVIQLEYPHFFDTNIEFISVAHNRNSNQAILSFFMEEFGKESEIHPLSSTNIANYEKWDSIRRISSSTTSENYVNQYLVDYLRLFSGNYYSNYRSLLEETRKDYIIPTGTCLPFSLRVFITARKDIIACERIGFDRILGKVTNEGLHIDFDGIVEFYNTILDKFKSQCVSCYKKELCTVCFLNDERYFKENFICEDFYPVTSLKKCIIESIKAIRKIGLNLDI